NAASEERGVVRVVIAPQQDGVAAVNDRDVCDPSGDLFAIQIEGLLFAGIIEGVSHVIPLSGGWRKWVAQHWPGERPIGVCAADAATEVSLANPDSIGVGRAVPPIERLGHNDLKDLDSIEPDPRFQS